MALPKAVQRKIDEANRLVEEMNKPAAPAAAAPPAGDPPAPPAGDPPAPAAPAAAAPPAGDPPGEVVPMPQEGWEQKYKVLQGKYNAEVPRLQGQVREQGEAVRQMREQLTATQNLLASLSSQRTAAPAPQEPPAPTRLVSDEETREFGPDLIDVMRRAAREEMASLMPQVDTKVRTVAQKIDDVASRTQHTEQQVAQDRKQQTIDYLHERVPNAGDVNKMPEFLEWLSQVDPYSKQERGALLTQAFQSYDGPRVVAFFQGFLNEHAAVTRRPAPAAPAPAAAPQRKLDDLVAPGTPKTGAASTQDGSGKRVWSRAEISEFYKNKAVKYRGRMQEADKIEAEIFAAQKEGRIR